MTNSIQLVIRNFWSSEREVKNAWKGKDYVGTQGCKEFREKIHQLPFTREAFSPQCSPRPSLFLLKAKVRSGTGVVIWSLPRSPGFATSLDCSLDSTCILRFAQGDFNIHNRAPQLDTNAISQYRSEGCIFQIRFPVTPEFLTSILLLLVNAYVWYYHPVV